MAVNRARFKRLKHQQATIKLGAKERVKEGENAEIVFCSLTKLV